MRMPNTLWWRCRPPNSVRAEGKQDMLDQADDSRSADTCAIKRLERGDEERWDAFAREAPQATFFHRAVGRGIM